MSGEITGATMADEDLNAKSVEEVRFAFRDLHAKKDLNAKSVEALQFASMVYKDVHAKSVILLDILLLLLVIESEKV